MVELQAQLDYNSQVAPEEARGLGGEGAEFGVGMGGWEIPPPLLSNTSLTLKPLEKVEVRRWQAGPENQRRDSQVGGSGARKGLVGRPALPR